MAQLPVARTSQLTNLVLQQSSVNASATDIPFQVINKSGVIVASIDASGDFTVAGAINPADIGTSGVPQVAYAKYNFAVDGGVIGLITPVVTSTIPANAIVYGAIINAPTAPVGAGATISIGTSAGSSAASLKAATAITSYTVDVLLAAVPVFTAASAFKMSAAGVITFTIAADALTAGVVEVWAQYVVSSAA